MLLMKDIHILHLHSGTFFLGAQAGILARTPIMVYTDHGRLLGETKIQLITDKISGFLVDKIVAVSKELGKYLKNIVGLQTQKIIVIENGINTGVFTDREKPEHLMREFNIPNNCKVIGTVGRLAEVKDQLTLIEAFKIVNDKIPNTMLIIVVDGPMYNQLDDAVKKTGLSHNVRLLGNIKDVDQLINIFDVFLLTSLSEGTSVSLLEAMSAGIAPIVTDVGGNLSIIEDQTNGLLVKPRQPRQIADNILKLLLDDNYRSVLSHEAQNTVRNKYSIHMMNRKYTELYTDLIKEKRLNLLD
jgi:glycosyltransferase involved in cell wall biosynthesis